LLLDEPTSALDLGHQMSVLAMIDELRVERNLTVVTAMHDLTATGRFADRLVLLDRGTIVASGPPVEVLTAEVLSVAYGSPVTILTADDGSLVVIPERTASDHEDRRVPRRTA
jgi:iron complex transport system ATP-binding protein